MTQKERNFLNDIKGAADQWSYDIEHYHENIYGDRYFTVEVDFDEEDWGLSSDEMWDALNEVANDWGAGIDSDGTVYSLSMEV